jgi:hypothetical protein
MYKYTSPNPDKEYRIAIQQVIAETLAGGVLI